MTDFSNKQRWDRSPTTVNKVPPVDIQKASYAQTHHLELLPLESRLDGCIITDGAVGYITDGIRPPVGGTSGILGEFLLVR
jgi:hypothetical protein